MEEQDKIVIYESEDGQAAIDVRVDLDSVWLSLNQLTELFQRDKSVVSRHISNVFRDGELDRKATVANYATVQNEGGREVSREIEYYNLDVIISVGYRVKSKRGTQFRIWASKVLKDYLLQGYALNQKRLKEKEQHLHELQKAVEVMSVVANRKALSSTEASGILEVLNQYSHALQVLDEYDHQQLKIEDITEGQVYELTYEEAVQQIDAWRKHQQAGRLFGNEKDESFKSSLQTIYQTFDGNDLYPSVEEKAANPLYLVVKNHSFSDGNKRIAAGLFVYFLKNNKALLTSDGHKRIADKPGKEHGLIIDYFGNLENLDRAQKTYSGDLGYDKADLEGTVTHLNEETNKVPQAHSEVWDIFKSIKNKYDEAAYEELLGDEAIRHRFYEKVSVFARLLKLALSSFDFVTSMPEILLNKYKEDAKFFLALRVSVKRRYFDDLEYKEYEPQVQKLIDTHITTEGEVLRITDLVNIFDKEQRELEVEKLTSKAAKADHITSRTIKAINVKMDEDPVYYKKLSRLIRDTIEDYHRHRISEAEYLKKAKELEDKFLNGQKEDVPETLVGKDTAIAIYHLLKEIFGEIIAEEKMPSMIAEQIDHIIQFNVLEKGKPIIDWQNKSDIEGKVRIEIDDYLFELQSRYGLQLLLNLIDELVEEGLKVAKLKYV